MLHAVRLGMRRGWTEFVQSLRSSQDQWFYLFTAFLAVGYLYLRRDTPVEGTDLLLPSVALPSILGGLHRVRPGDRARLQPGDGEGGRHAPARQGGAQRPRRATSPASWSALRRASCPQMVAVLVPSFLLFDDLMADPSRLVHRRVGAGARPARHAADRHDDRRPGARRAEGRHVGDAAGHGARRHLRHLLPRAGALGLGAGGRAGLPDVLAGPGHALRLPARQLPPRRRSAAPGAPGRPCSCSAAWAVVGALVAPALLRRMARRQSGSQVAAAREAATQWVK